MPLMLLKEGFVMNFTLLPGFVNFFSEIVKLTGLSGDGHRSITHFLPQENKNDFRQC